MSYLERIATRLDIPDWGFALIKILLWAFSIAAVAMGVIFVQLYFLKGDIGRLDGKIDGVPAALAQKLVDQSKKYVDLGNTGDASRSLQLAAAFIDTAKKNKVPVNTAFFEDTYIKLNQLKSVPELSNELQDARLQLANYRSALQPAPKLTGPKKQAGTPISPIDLKGWSQLLMVAPGEFLVRDTIVKKLSDNIVVENLAFIGGVDGVRQTLDGIHWINDIFINVHIQYEGGEAMLLNVKFINCTFETTNNERGNQILDYAILSKPETLVIGQGAASSSKSHTPVTTPVAIAGVTRNDE